ncbi:MAG: phosphopentomutase, partial [Pseudomonadota bacterium]
TSSRKASGNAAIGETTLGALGDAKSGDLVFSNFVDFDMLYGHRRDVAGYAAALEAFDRYLPALLDQMASDDLLLITADHGCDPTWHGTDHTRERVPIIGRYGRGGHMPCPIGVRPTFADMAATLGAHIGLADTGPDGTSFLDLVRPLS